MNPIITEALEEARENFGFNRHDKKHIQKLKYVLAQSGSKRWRSTADLYLWLNPVTRKIDPVTGRMVLTEDARMANRHVIAAVAEMRHNNELAGNKYAASSDKNSTRRHAFTMPAGMLRLIELIDPDVLQGTPEERKASIHELMRTFPEYCVAPRI